MSYSAAIHIVSPAEFDQDTAQTPGSERRAAIAPALGIASAIWGGLFEVGPGFRTGVIGHVKRLWEQSNTLLKIELIIAAP